MEPLYESLGETYWCRVCHQRFNNFADFKACLRRHGVDPTDFGSGDSLVGAQSDDEKDRKDRKGKSKEDELGALVYSRRKPTSDGTFFSAGPPKSGFSLGSSYRSSPGSFRFSLGKGGFSFKSPGGYETAYSSFSSYKTAPLVVAAWKEPVRTTRSSGANPGAPSTGSISWMHDVPVIDYGYVTEFVDCIILEASKYMPPGFDTVQDLKISLIRQLHVLAFKGETESIIALAQVLSMQICEAFCLQKPVDIDKLNTYILDQLRRLVDSRGRSHSMLGATLASITGTEVFSSEWLEHLRSRGILVEPKDELDWSGRGQHVEYAAKDLKDIPLRAEKILGHSATALVESVMCRRIRLARKSIRCSKKLSKEDAITEVEHLQRVQHSHVVRVVGTYTLKKDLAILLYPAADWSLEEFMDDTVDAFGEKEWKPRVRALTTFFGCLAYTICFLHKRNVKHMDIKPKNILVRLIDLTESVPLKDMYKVYIADFGIARAYQSAAEVETDSPTSYTRTYAAPEVVDQDTRGFSADIFSLGCVFMEMLAAVLSRPQPELNERSKLQNIRCDENGDASYCANIEAIRNWYDANASFQWTADGELTAVSLLGDEFAALLPDMINESPKSRPDARKLSVSTRKARCSRCKDGPEPFEAAKPMADR